MAALIRHGLLANPFKSTSSILTVNTASARCDIARYKHKAKKPVKKLYTKIEPTWQSIACKGFLRSQKAYDPPRDVSDRIDRICESQTVSTADATRIEDPLLRFNIFAACAKELKYSIPNSILHTITTVGDLRKHYSTPLDVRTPYYALQQVDLPKNLHVRQEYLRFHPDTDTLFGGRTAFPKSSTLVTGLKYKKKYPGHLQEDPFLEEMMKL